MKGGSHSTAEVLIFDSILETPGELFKTMVFGPHTRELHLLGSGGAFFIKFPRDPDAQPNLSNTICNKISL